MNYTFLKQHNHQELILLVSGWSISPSVFEEYIPENKDFLIVHGFSSLDFDYSLLTSYRRITLIGFSMGVWAAAHLFASHTAILFCEKIAINGTPLLIDDQCGIPAAIYQGTLDGLDDKNLQKFHRRMLASTDGYRQFVAANPIADIAVLKQELSFVQTHCTHFQPPAFSWDKAIIGQHDRIFPPDNQLHAWGLLNATIYQEEAAHFEPSLFAQWIH